jgi:hypothetical protein
MSKLNLNGKTSGQMSEPYNYKENNHYALDGQGDLRLYHIDIHREGDTKFEIGIYERNGKDEYNQKAKVTMDLKVNVWAEINPAFPKQKFVIQSTGAPGSKVKFNVASKNALEFSKGDFIWDSEDAGIAGKYCEVGGVDKDKKQVIKCNVPVLA